MRLLPLALCVTTLLAGPVWAQDPASDEAILNARTREQVASFVQPTNAARAEAAMALIRAAGFEPQVETFEGGNRQTGPMEGRNITFQVAGVADIEDALKPILLVAHYDAVTLDSGRLADGVIDNAGSVVAVIQAAEHLRNQHLGRDVQVILFDQEELGLIGARKWIEANGVDNVAAVVNSDVAAYGDTMMYGQNNGPQSAVVTRVVQTMCVELALTCVGFPNYPPSDDRAFSAAGAPVVSLGFQDRIGAHQMWLAFNGGRPNGLAEDFVPSVFQRIHSEGDTMEHLDPATVRTAARTYAEIIKALDGVLTR